MQIAITKLKFKTYLLDSFLFLFQSSYRINSLMYNTEYNVKVELQQANQRTSTEWVGEVDFKTDLCEEVDEQTYTKCKIGLNPDETVPETPIVEEKEERGQCTIRSRTVCIYPTFDLNL